MMSLTQPARRRFFLPATLLIALIGLTACHSAAPKSGAAGSATVSSPPNSAVTGVANAPGAGACSLLPQADLSQAVGGPVSQGSGSAVPSPPGAPASVALEACSWTAPGRRMTLLVRGSDPAASKTVFDTEKQQALAAPNASDNGVQSISGIGDDAWFSGSSLNVLKGGRILTFGTALTDATATPASRQQTLDVEEKMATAALRHL
jgi:hypothetical protein